MTQWRISSIREQRGYTLVELVMVMIIIGTLAAVAMNRFSLSGYQATAAQGEVVSAIRYAQEKSMTNTGATPFRVTINSNGYAVTQGAAAVPHPLDSGSNYSNSWSDISLAPTGTLEFDGYGEPSVISGALAFSGNQEVISVSSSADTRTVTIEQTTGFVR